MPKKLSLYKSVKTEREVLERRRLMLSTSPVNQKLQISGIILILGLIVEALCLLLGHGPIAFMVFAGLGGALFAAGILLYLYSLVSANAEPPEQC